jgi:hypothetical protein
MALALNSTSAGPALVSTPNTSTATGTVIPSGLTFAQLVAQYPAPSGNPAYLTADQGLSVWSGTAWATVNGGSGVSNLTAQNTQKLRAGIARVRANLGTLKVAYLGDSTSLGDYAVTGNVFAGAHALMPATQLASILSGRGLPAQADNFFGNGNIGTPATYTAFYPAVVFTNYVANAAGVTSLGDFSFSATTSGASIVYTPVTAFDTIDIYTLNLTTLGSFTVNVDGGATLATISTSTTPAYTKNTVSCTLGTHTINIATTSATQSFINGITVRSSVTARAEIYTIGWSAGTAANHATTIGNYRPLLALPVVAPDVTFINLTINDISGATNLTSYTNSLQSLITAAQLSGDCILMVGSPGSSANFTDGTAAAYINTVYSLAATNNIPVLDITQRWVSYAVANAVMPYGDNSFPPPRHPSGIGYADIASAMSLFF